MKRWLWRASLLGAALWVAFGGWGKRYAKADSGYTITFEAENANRIDEPMKKRTGTKTDQSAKPKKNSGKGYVEIPVKANSGKKKGDDVVLPGRAVFKVNVGHKGTYHLWARVLWRSGCENSFWVKVGAKPRVLLEESTYNAWHWVKLDKQVTLASGVNLIEFQNREDGVCLDEVQLRTSEGVPVGEVKPTSNALAE